MFLNDHICHFYDLFMLNVYCLYGFIVLHICMNKLIIINLMFKEINLNILIVLLTCTERYSYQHKNDLIAISFNYF